MSSAPAAPAHAAKPHPAPHAPPSVTPQAVGRNSTWITWTPATTTLSWSGNTISWSRGIITVHVWLRDPKGNYTNDWWHDCENATSCSSPTFSICPAVAGLWESIVEAWGPGGYARQQVAIAWVEF